MSFCSVQICKNYRKKSDLNDSATAISYHRFPKDREIVKQWIAATGQKDNWHPSPRVAICSEHFEKTCFIENGGRRFLKQGSVPTLKIQSIHANQPAAASVSHNLCEKFIKEDEEVNDQLINKLQREKDYYKYLAIKRQKKIKIAAQKIRRLTKKSMVMENILEMLISKDNIK